MNKFIKIYYDEFLNKNPKNDYLIKIPNNQKNWLFNRFENQLNIFDYNDYKELFIDNFQGNNNRLINYAGDYDFDATIQLDYHEGGEITECVYLAYTLSYYIYNCSIRLEFYELAHNIKIILERMTRIIFYKETEFDDVRFSTDNKIEVDYIDLPF